MRQTERHLSPFPASFSSAFFIMLPLQKAIVIRIGEIYLNDAEHVTGYLKQKTISGITNATASIHIAIPSVFSKSFFPDSLYLLTAPVTAAISTGLDDREEDIEVISCCAFHDERVLQKL